MPEYGTVYNCPRSVWQEYPCSVADTSVSFGGITFDGTDLVRHLKGCSSLLLFAATWA